VLFAFNKYSESALSGNLYSEKNLPVESGFCTVLMVKFLEVCILCHIACEVSLSLCCKFDLRYVKSLHNLRTLIVNKRARKVQVILAAVQFRMLHVLIYETDILPVILCWCEIWCLASREQQIEGL
jgi:hypothetical protein